MTRSRSFRASPRTVSLPLVVPDPLVKAGQPVPTLASVLEVPSELADLLLGNWAVAQARRMR